MSASAINSDGDARKCFGCHHSFSTEQFSKYQWRLWKGRCISCISKEARVTPLWLESIEYCFRSVFSDAEWLTLVEDWQVSRIPLDEVSLKSLSSYEVFQRRCQQVDSETLLYPLQRAIQLGYEWEEGAKHIYEACPDISTYPHPKSGILAFQLAACNANKESTDLTYSLLRASPEVVHRKLFDPTQMIHDPAFYTGYAYFDKRTAVVNWDDEEYEYSSMDEEDEADCSDDEEMQEDSNYLSNKGLKGRKLRQSTGLIPS